MCVHSGMYVHVHVCALMPTRMPTPQHVCACTLMIHRHAYTYMCTHTCTHIFSHAHACTYMCTHAHEHAHRGMYVHVHTGFTYIHLHSHSCTCTDMHTHGCTHSHTCAHREHLHMCKPCMGEPRAQVSLQCSCTCVWVHVCEFTCVRVPLHTRAHVCACTCVKT